jgi:hypothetical protein
MPKYILFVVKPKIVQEFREGQDPENYWSLRRFLEERCLEYGLVEKGKGIFKKR